MEVEADAATKTHETQAFAVMAKNSEVHFCHPPQDLLSKRGVFQETISHIFWEHSNLCCHSFSMLSHHLEEILRKKPKQIDEPEAHIICCIVAFLNQVSISIQPFLLFSLNQHP